MSIIGNYKKQPADYSAFIPADFPPTAGFDISQDLLRKNSQAEILLGKLDGITQLVPDIDFFISMYVLKDATSSSQIEGTKATMMDALEANAGVETDIPEDVDDIIHYIKALNYGIGRSKELPISLRFIRELHETLMKKARSTHYASPGEFRTTQNWVGGTSPSNARFVPPPPGEMKRALNDFEAFIHSEKYLPLIKAALAHAQFETIHPFLDGNGRVGRLLITMHLWIEGILERPVLFLSHYFKKHQKAYYERLQLYNDDGDFEKWLDFFLGGVIETAKEGIASAREITDLREKDIMKIQSLDKKSSESATKVLPQLFRQPIVTVGQVAEWTGFTRRGAQKVIDRFIKLGILEERSDEYRKTYFYKRYYSIFIKNDR